MSRNYLIIRRNEDEKDRYAEKMLSENQIPGLLPFHMKQVDGQAWFCYDITSRQPLERLLEYRNMNGEEIRRMISDILYTVNQMEKFLLDESCLYLTPAFIYAEPDSFRCFLCPIPGSRQDFCGDFRNLSRYMLDHVSHLDTQAVVLTFGIFRESSKDSFSLESMERLIRQTGQPDAEKEKEDRWEPSVYGTESPEAVFRGFLSGTGREKHMEQHRAEAAPGADRLASERSGTVSGERKDTSGPGKRGIPDGYIKKKDEKRSESGVPERLAKGGPLKWTTALLGTAAAVLAAGFAASGYIRPAAFSPNHLLLAAAALALLGITVWTVRDKWIAFSEYRHTGRPSSEREKEQKAWEVRFRELDGEESREYLPDAGTLCSGEKPVKPSARLRDTERARPPAGTFFGMAEPDPADEDGETDELQTVLLYDGAAEEEQGRLVPVKGGEEIKIGYFPFIIGKSSSLTDYCLESPGVSRLHLRLDQTEKGYTATDLNSTNGTRIDGKKLEANETCELSKGALVEIAGLQFYFL